MSDKPPKWEAVDQPWLIPTNSRLGINYVGPGKLFAEAFVNKPPHTALEFGQWCATIPEFASRTDYNVIRQGLYMAGYREDMPTPYDIERVGMTWQVRPMFTALQNDPFMEPVKKAARKAVKLFLDRMRASDLTRLTPQAYGDLIALFETYQSVVRHIELYVSDMHRLQQRIVLSLVDKPESLPQGETPQLDF